MILRKGLSLARDTNYRMQFWCWRVSVFPYLIPLPLYMCVCVCVCVCFSNKKRYSMLSSYPTLVRCDIEKGFITCSATLTAACSFGVDVWVYSFISSPFPYICVCVSQIKKKKWKQSSSYVTLNLLTDD